MISMWSEWRRTLVPEILISLLLLWGCGPNGTSDQLDQTGNGFSIHWVTDEPGSDFSMCEVRATGEEIAVEQPPLVTLFHFDSMSVEEDMGSFFVAAWMTEEGRGIVERLTGENIGRRLAIVLDDQVLAMPLIRRPLQLPSFPLFPTTADSARALAGRLSDALTRARENK